MRRTPYSVQTTATKVVRFSDPNSAQEYAQFYSARYVTFCEVIAPDGLIGQYKYGEPTAEFRGRGDEWYPAGPRPRSQGNAST